MNNPIKIDKIFFDILDQVYEIEKKLKNINESNSISRNVTRLKEIFQHIQYNSGLEYDDPMGQKCDVTRTDVDFTIAGEAADNLYITEVIKPIIRHRMETYTHIVRKGVVVVEAKK